MYTPRNKKKNHSIEVDTVKKDYSSLKMNLMVQKLIKLLTIHFTHLDIKSSKIYNS